MKGSHITAALSGSLFMHSTHMADGPQFLAFFAALMLALGTAVLASEDE